MLLTDYFRSEHDITWDYAKQCGVNHGVIRLPEDPSFDVANPSHWQTVYDRFQAFDITPVVIEPMPNALHDHIKTGSSRRNWAIGKVIQMFHIMDMLNIRTICFNFMAHVGWCRTSYNIPERGGAQVTGFRLEDFHQDTPHITEKALWDNYTYFIKAVLPHAERHGIRLALHPDDPPIPQLGNISCIMISHQNILRALDIGNSDALGVTFCQATYRMMGEDLFQVVPDLGDKIFFIHFRNATGSCEDFRETFHDNGALPMAELIALYRTCGLDVPIRVDHVPTMAGEAESTGYTALGRLFAIGYLKGLLEMAEQGGDLNELLY